MLDDRPVEGDHVVVEAQLAPRGGGGKVRPAWVRRGQEVGLSLVLELPEGEE